VRERETHLLIGWETQSKMECRTQFVRERETHLLIGWETQPEMECVIQLRTEYRNNCTNDPEIAANRVLTGDRHFTVGKLKCLKRSKLLPALVCL
jgi:hypothetical protein